MTVRLNPSWKLPQTPQLSGALKRAADEVAANVHAQGIKVGDENGGPDEVALPVLSGVDSADPSRALVTIAHAAGEAVQAKHGALTKAAAQAGLPVQGPK